MIKWHELFFQGVKQIWNNICVVSLKTYPKKCKKPRSLTVKSLTSFYGWSCCKIQRNNFTHQRNNYFDSTNYLYIQQNSYLYIQRNNYFDSTNYLYIQQNNYLYIQRNNDLYIQRNNYLCIHQNNYFHSTNYLHSQGNNYFDSTNYLYIRRIIYISNEIIISIQQILFNEWIEVFLFNQIVIKYMVNKIWTWKMKSGLYFVWIYKRSKTKTHIAQAECW